MQATKHTNGPWGISTSAKGLAISGHRNAVCTIQFLDDQAKVDAALIAAAPDMLALLIEAAGMIRANLHPIQSGTSAASLLEDIDAIIAKVAGSVA